MTAEKSAPRLPAVRPITTGDIRAAIGQGIRDMSRAPAYSLFFGLVFSIIGVAISYLLIVVGSSYWVLPLAAGFPLIGPLPRSASTRSAAGSTTGSR